ncbi:hypothetical protein WNY58_14235 [Neptuniibacter pectenicola]|jgi:hypothetical protein|uniref:BFD-like [2Fe-2S] binding domain-containing protein n=1 Tax=Neptuniibacter pectenicola TaxID=1806669 RepID=A0ABU9TWB6_9GAMM|nr:MULTISPECIES: hypothetical protein [unclassified Neptuniibacter]MDO6514059.1 hypothetical protein [Neptuniibacter sp. 2_MG-2023]MDO6594104.1 hypothetical protein [Neptuniibacter sp. 1_MG-2023]
MKPDTTEAMQTLIKQIRETIPFDMPVALMCNGPCTGCAKKLLDYLDMELLDKEKNLKEGEIPNLGDIDKLAKTAKKIYRSLQKNGLVD